MHLSETLVRADSEEWGCWVTGYMYFHLYQITYVFFNSENVSQGSSAVSGIEEMRDACPCSLTGLRSVLQTCPLQPSHPVPSGTHRPGPLAAGSSPASLLQ